MAFKPISPGHPFLADLKKAGLADSQDRNRLFQPETENWPIYEVAYRKLESGFSINVSVKRNMLSVWETCNYFNPIPFELAPIITSIVSYWYREPGKLEEPLASFVRFRQDLRQLLADNGVPSNPGCTEDDIVRAFRQLLETKKAV